MWIREKLGDIDHTNKQRGLWGKEKESSTNINM
jgi:hypothetical protein